jgi:hypothetical protein
MGGQTLLEKAFYNNVIVILSQGKEKVSDPSGNYTSVAYQQAFVRQHSPSTSFSPLTDKAQKRTITAI